MARAMAGVMRMSGPVTVSCGRMVVMFAPAYSGNFLRNLAILAFIAKREQANT